MNARHRFVLFFPFLYFSLPWLRLYCSAAACRIVWLECFLWLFGKYWIFVPVEFTLSPQSRCHSHDLKLIELNKYNGAKMRESFQIVGLANFQFKMCMYVNSSHCYILDFVENISNEHNNFINATFLNWNSKTLFISVCWLCCGSFKTFQNPQIINSDEFIHWNNTNKPTEIMNTLYQKFIEWK